MGRATSQPFRSNFLKPIVWLVRFMHNVHAVHKDDANSRSIPERPTLPFNQHGFGKKRQISKRVMTNEQG